MSAKDIDYDTVVRLYWNSEPNWSTFDLAQYFDCGVSSINRFMVKHNIPRRTLSEAQIEKWRCDFKRENTITALREKVWNTDEFKEKQSRNAIEQYEKHPEHKKILSDKQKEKMKDPKRRKILSDKQKEKWKDLEYREKMNKILSVVGKKRYHNDPNHPLRIKNERYWTGDKKESD